jgi:hypothetical protein
MALSAWSSAASLARANDIPDALLQIGMLETHRGRAIF